MKVLAAVVIASVVLGGCSLGDRKQRAEFVEASVARLADDGTVSGRFTVGFAVVEVPATSTVALGPAQASGGQAFPDLTVGVTLDVTGRRAAVEVGAGVAPSAPVDGAIDLSPVEGGAKVALFVHDGLEVYSFRTGQTTSVSNRNWSRLDLREIDDEPDLTLQDVADRLGMPLLGIVNPVLVTELAVAVLDGSIDESGTDEVGGVEVTVYDANVSLEQYLIEIDPPEDERRAIERVFGNVAVDPEAVAPARLWVDAQGRLRKISVTFTLKPARRTEFALTYTVEVDGPSADVVEIPAADDSLSIDTIGQLIQPFRSNG